jgi:ribosomal protein S18 acetylase RimI-like enzyme
MKFKQWINETNDVTVKMGVGGMKEGFSISKPDGSRVVGYAYNADFPGEYSREDRGELFYIEVPKHLRRQGLGVSLAKQALELMKSHGCTTVNVDGVSPEGRALINHLTREGNIKFIRSSKTGKSEFELL